MACISSIMETYTVEKMSENYYTNIEIFYAYTVY